MGACIYGGAAVVIEVTSTQVIYLLHDHLGSTGVITGASGNVQTRYSFDASRSAWIGPLKVRRSAGRSAWGARRQVAWAAFMPMGIPPTLWQTPLTTRGFTGHEELDEVGLVHMNGRVYDPQLGRFLSADPVVQDATDLQAYNHYAYVRNNPLSLLDPSGFSWLGDIFKAIGNFFSSVFHAIETAIKAILRNTIVRAIIQIAICAMPGVNAIGCAAAVAGLSLAAGGTPLQALESFAMTVVSAGVWGGNAVLGDLGSGLPDLGGGVHGFLDRAASFLGDSGANGLGNLSDLIGGTRVLVHSVVNGALTVAQGGHFMQGFAVGAAGEAGSEGMQEAGLTNVNDYEVRFARALIAGALGGTASLLTGGKFANGAITAAFASLYNDTRKDYRIRECSDLVLDNADYGGRTNEDTRTNAFQACYNTCMGIDQDPKWTPYFPDAPDYWGKDNFQANPAPANPAPPLVTAPPPSWTSQIVTYLVIVGTSVIAAFNH